MPRSRHSFTRVRVAARDSVAENIWKLLPPVKRPWSLPENEEKLIKIIGKKDTRYIYSINDSHQQNRELRHVISRRLRRYPPERRADLMEWIVHDWGRITRGRKSTRAWTYELRSFHPNDIEKFISFYHKRRISSWSKIIAFADQRHHAIYDSRTSVSLNVILDKLDLPYRFFMPESRNTELPAVIDDVRQKVISTFRGSPRNRYRVYNDYIDLLYDIKDSCGVEDITEIEMRLFDFAEDFANEYATKYGIEIKPSEKKDKPQLKFDFKS